MQPIADSSQQKRRLLWLQILLCGLGLLTVGRLVDLQVLQHRHYADLAAAEHQRKYEVPAKRGEIYVRDGEVKVPLALNQTLKLLYADPSIIPDDQRDKDSQALAGVTGEPASHYSELLSQKQREYVVLKQKINGDMAQKITDLHLYGIGMVDQNYRVYPEGQLASQVLGFVNDDGSGQYGIEGYLNSHLAGEAGLLNAKTDTNGVPIATANNIIKPPVNGTSYVLTIDRNIQAQAEKLLKQGVENVKAKSGSVVIMDPKTGAIKAMANYPTFDPNTYGQVKDYSTFGNSVVSDAFEPGSGFKIITMSAGLDAGKVTPTSTYTDNGCEVVDGYSVCNAENHKKGPNTTMTNVIRDSLNTGVMYVLRLMGSDPNKITPQSKQVFYNYITKHFGFGIRTGIEQANESSGNVNSPTHSDVNYANMTFGQGISVTMMQMLVATQAIANNGKMYQPYLVEQTIDPGGSTHSTTPRIVNEHVISPQAAHDITGMMQVVVEHGSGYLAHIPGYNIAGKTGTAQIPRADGKGYEEGKNIGSFTGFGPVEDPRFVMMVRINDPQVNGFAESTTVPVFSNISRFLLNYYGIPPAAK